MLLNQFPAADVFQVIARNAETFLATVQNVIGQDAAVCVSQQAFRLVTVVAQILVDTERKFDHAPGEQRHARFERDGHARAIHLRQHEAGHEGVKVDVLKTRAQGQVVAPVLVIIGWYSRLGALLIAINMLFAVALAHRAELFKLAASGGYALELQVLFASVAIVLALMGPGRYSLNER